jgi:hypothetical protein
MVNGCCFNFNFTYYIIANTRQGKEGNTRKGKARKGKRLRPERQGKAWKGKARHGRKA